MKYLDKEEKAIIKEAKKRTKRVLKEVEKGTHAESTEAKKLRAAFGEAVKNYREKERKTEALSLRITPSDLAGLKEVAQRKGLPYQTYLTSLIHEALEKELQPRQ